MNTPFRSTASARAIRQLSMLCATLLPVLLAAGCALNPAKPGNDSGGLVSRALESLGMSRDAGRDKTTGTDLAVNLHAAANLNAANDRVPLAVVVRLYRLKQGERFDQAPYQSFLDEASERAALGDDLIDVSEIVLQPGQRHQLTSHMPADASVLGVVALFRSPARNRWRMAFSVKDATTDAVTIGLHACALTTNSASLVTRLAEEPHRLSTARCGE